ncbi:MAG: LPP20 family lipoprotein [Kiritimatiellales bacterium]|nr:LPP20 family lipoprotein [Kiritimatiellales bacterium]
MVFWKNGFLALLLVPAMLTGCKTSPPAPSNRPKWADNPKTAYPDSAYLVAIGEGDTRRGAENAAAANLARIFESHIESDERLKENSRETLTDFERTTDFGTDISILSSQTLFNIQHAESWIDSDGRVHAVAYLDRRETAAIYRGKIGEKNARVHFLDASAAATDDILRKYATLRAAIREAAESRILLKQLEVIHPPSVPETTPGYSIDRIRQQFADAAKQIRVRIRIENDREQKINSAVEELVTSQGFVLGSPPVLEIIGSATITDTGMQTAGLIFVRYQLTLNVADQTGATLVSFTETGREAHINLDEAGLRSLRTLETAIKTSFRQRIDEYFNSLADQMPR